MKHFGKLCQLVLIEEFKGCFKTYNDKQKTESLQQAAVLADDYSLTNM